MKSKLLYIFLVAILMLGGCQGSSQDSQQVYQKRAEVISVSNEPASYRSFALVSSGNIHVGGKLTTDGPLAIGVYTSLLCLIYSKGLPYNRNEHRINIF